MIKESVRIPCSILDQSSSASRSLEQGNRMKWTPLPTKVRLSSRRRRNALKPRASVGKARGEPPRTAFVGLPCVADPPERFTSPRVKLRSRAFPSKPLNSLVKSRPHTVPKNPLPRAYSTRDRSQNLSLSSGLSSKGSPGKKLRSFRPIFEANSFGTSKTHSKSRSKKNKNVHQFVRWRAI